jgi:protein-S-isoprenylcysteine O-methyltransferase Ste14
MKKVRRYAVAYFIAQGVGVLAWWILLFAYPALLAFLLPDISFIALGSLVTAALVHFENRFEVVALWFVTGATSYAAIYSFTFTLLTDRGWVGVALMFPAMLWSGVFATGITAGMDMFRAAKESSTNYVIAKTSVQIVVVWTIILLVFPYLITLLEDKLGIVRLEFAYQKTLAIVVFIAVSSIGIWAAVSMSRIGRGTPLPLDHAKALVVVGPYAYVRNPMALSGIMQGLAVALFLGSPLVAIYALIGSAIWQLIFRPLEEDDLAVRFGESFLRYRSGVRCWLPHTSPYQSDSTADSSNSMESPLGRT